MPRAGLQLAWCTAAIIRLKYVVEAGQSRVTCTFWLRERKHCLSARQIDSEADHARIGIESPATVVNVETVEYETLCVHVDETLLHGPHSLPMAWPLPRPMIYSMAYGICPALICQPLSQRDNRA